VTLINRKQIRVAVLLQVKFRIEGDADKSIYRGVTRDISRSGVCIVAQEEKSRLISLLDGKLPKVTLSIYLTKDDKLIDVQSRTAWISSKVGWFVTPEKEGMPLLIGTSFENISREDTDKMDCFMEELMKGDSSSIEDIKERLVSRLDKMRRETP
jgi:c-di-GMP-binding flagellar brake protein YcgR